MADTFNNANVIAGTTRTALYGPVAANTVAIVFSGTFANVDTAKSSHKITLEKKLSGTSTYYMCFCDVPIEYGGASKVPKIVLKAGETLYVTADAANAVQCVISLLERT